MRRRGVNDGTHPEALFEAAAAWLARRQEGTDARQEQAFADWLMAHPSHRHVYDRVSRSWGGLAEMASLPRIAQLREEALAGRRSRWPAVRRAAGAVAALAIAALIGAVGFSYWPGLPTLFAPPDQIADERGPAAVELLSMAAGRPTMTLADGSKITLNSDARVRVAYGGRERRIALLSGQAFFQVAHDRSRPFVVSVGDREVVALGTQFDIRVDQRRVVVALLEGRVNVRPQTGAAKARPVALAPGEQVRFAVADPATIIQAANVADLARWREGRVRFDATPLAEAVAEMNRYNAVPIHIADRALDRLKVSGVFRTGQSDSFVSALTDIFPVRAERTETGIALRRSASSAR